MLFNQKFELTFEFACVPKRTILDSIEVAPQALWLSFSYVLVSLEFKRKVWNVVGNYIVFSLLNFQQNYPEIDSGP